MASLETLLVEQTKADVKATMLSVLALLGFPTTSWQEGGVALTIIEAIAEVYSDASAAVSSIAAGGFLQLASGVWLTLLAKSQYDRERIAATYATIDATLTAAPTSGPHTVNVGEHWTSNTAGTLRFKNTTGGTLPLGGTLSLVWEAEVAGSDYNVADNEVNTMVTQLAGVTVNNPGPDSLVSAGRDEETDDELRLRCQVRWAELGLFTKDAIVSYALNANAEITRVFVDDQNPAGPGTAYIYVANATGGATAGAVTDVQNAILDKKPITALPTTFPAPNLAVAVTATVYAHATSAPTVTECEDAVKAYFKTLDIGGDDIPALAPARLFVDQIENSLLDLSGVISVDLTSPSGDVTMADNEVAVPTVTIVVVAV